MKLDTSSYYPKSHLDDDGDDSPVFSESTAADSSPESCPEPSSEAVYEPDLPPSELEAGITQLSDFRSFRSLTSVCGLPSRQSYSDSMW